VKGARRRLIALSAVTTAAVLVSGSGAVAGVTDVPTPKIARGPHVSGAAQATAHRSAKAGQSATTQTTCSTPGNSNYKTDCRSGGFPVNEPWIASNGSLFVAGANDYNSYNSQGQFGYYWSSDAVHWNDAGPLDLFPHDANNAGSDPGLAIDQAGVVYYSGIFFNFSDCNVGGLELLRRNPATGSWGTYQIAANSSAQFQDKPALAIDSSHVFVSWTQFGSCTGQGVASPIRVAVLPSGATSGAPTAVLSVPGSTYSQGSSIAADGSGGFWIAWEEYPASDATVGTIKLAHWNSAAGWGETQTISPAGFQDLPNPLPGFSFRDNSFPALAVVNDGSPNGSPRVVWTSYDTGVGRAHLWSPGMDAALVSNSGRHQFFPAIASDGSGGVYVSYSQIGGNDSYDEYLWHGGAPTKISTASSYPNRDIFFSGQFIGDYSAMMVVYGAKPIWTDIRGPGVLPFYEMDPMVYAQPVPPKAPAAPVLVGAAGNGLVRLSWGAPADGGSPLTGYRLYRGTSSGDESLVVALGVVTSYVDTGVVNGTGFYYQLSAVNAVGEGPRSAEIAVMPSADAPLDDFNRANENPLSDGGRWLNGISSSSEKGLVVSSNQVACTITTTATAWRSVGAYGPDSEAWVTIATLPGVGNAVRVYARLQAPGSAAVDGYMVRFQQQSGTDQVFIDRLDNAAVTTLASFNQEFAAGDRLRISVVGSTVQAWRYSGGSWTKLGEVSDSTYPAAGYIGVGLRGTTGRLDDYGGRAAP
jgi:Fibronectin type III domain